MKVHLSDISGGWSEGELVADRSEALVVIVDNELHFRSVDVERESARFSEAAYNVSEGTRYAAVGVGRASNTTASTDLEVIWGVAQLHKGTHADFHWETSTNGPLSTPPVTNHHGGNQSEVIANSRWGPDAETARRRMVMQEGVRAQRFLVEVASQVGSSVDAFLYVNTSASCKHCAPNTSTPMTTKPSPSWAKLTVADRAEAHGRLEFASRRFSAREDSGRARVWVTRVGGSRGELNASFMVTPAVFTSSYAHGGQPIRAALPCADAVGLCSISTTPGADYHPTSGHLLFEDGVTLLSFTVPIINDPEYEPMELVNLTLVASDPDDVHATPTTVTSELVILDDADMPGILGFAQDVYVFSERATWAFVSVTRLGGSSGRITVNYRTANQTWTGSKGGGDRENGGSSRQQEKPRQIPATATPGPESDPEADYLPAEGSLVFERGVTGLSFRVRLFDDPCGEGPLPETVGLELWDPTTTDATPPGCGSNPECFGLGQGRAVTDANTGIARFARLGVATAMLHITDEEDLLDDEVVRLKVVEQPGQGHQVESMFLDRHPVVQAENACGRRVNISTGTVAATLMTRRADQCLLSARRTKREIQELRIIPLTSVCTSANCDSGNNLNNVSAEHGQSFLTTERDLSIRGGGSTANAWHERLDVGQRIIIAENSRGAPQQLTGTFTVTYDSIFVQTSIDVTSEIVAGQQLRLESEHGEDLTVVAHIAGLITLSTHYRGRSLFAVNGYAVPAEYTVAGFSIFLPGTCCLSNAGAVLDTSVDLSSGRYRLERDDVISIAAASPKNVKTVSATDYSTGGDALETTKGAGSIETFTTLKVTSMTGILRSQQVSVRKLRGRYIVQLNAAYRGPSKGSLYLFKSPVLPGKMTPILDDPSMTKWVRTTHDVSRSGIKVGDRLDIHGFPYTINSIEAESAATTHGATLEDGGYQIMSSEMTMAKLMKVGDAVRFTMTYADGVFAEYPDPDAALALVRKGALSWALTSFNVERSSANTITGPGLIFMVTAFHVGAPVRFPTLSQAQAPAYIVSAIGPDASGLLGQVTLVDAAGNAVSLPVITGTIPVEIGTYNMDLPQPLLNSLILNPSTMTTLTDAYVAVTNVAVGDTTLTVTGAPLNGLSKWLRIGMTVRVAASRAEALALHSVGCQYEIGAGWDEATSPIPITPIALQACTGGYIFRVDLQVQLMRRYRKRSYYMSVNNTADTPASPWTFGMLREGYDTSTAVAASSITATGSGTGLALSYISSSTHITSITVTAGGSGYAISDVVTIAASAMPGRSTAAKFILVADDIAAGAVVITTDALLGSASTTAGEDLEETITDSGKGILNVKRVPLRVEFTVPFLRGVDPAITRKLDLPATLLPDFTGITFQLGFRGMTTPNLEPDITKARLTGFLSDHLQVRGNGYTQRRNAVPPTG